MKKLRIEREKKEKKNVGIKRKKEKKEKNMWSKRRKKSVDQK